MSVKNEQVIVSVSRRTDIPAFYSEWFMKRIDAGFCKYPNPFCPSRVYQVSLKPEDVAGFVFWTRNPEPLMPHLATLDEMGYGYYFLITINGYPTELEPRSPAKTQIIDTVAKLAERIGKERIIWRYDPILLTPELDRAWHQQNFSGLLDSLQPYTRKVIISVIDPYRKTKRHLKIGPGKEVDYEVDHYLPLLEWMSSYCYERQFEISCCAEPDLQIQGIAHGPCADADLLAEVTGKVVKKAKHRQRPGCSCHRSVDIGVNNTCGFGCRYCYATNNHDKAQAYLKQHNPNLNSLAGEL